MTHTVWKERQPSSTNDGTPLFRGSLPTGSGLTQENVVKSNFRACKTFIRENAPDCNTILK